jgi:hypothetical protein
MDKAIVVLTRGYSDMKQYDQLLTRNEHISKNLKNKLIPIVLFHEGNITNEHQIYIKSKSPDLEISFVNISSTSFLDEKKSIPFFPRTDHPPWQIGYRHMCNFWFKDFFKHVTDYNYIFRIDEDCYVQFSIDDAFSEIENGNIPFLYGTTFGDPGWVVTNMNQTTIEFMKSKGQDVKKRRAVGPLSCVFGLNLIKIREKMDILSEYHDYIDKSNGIYQYRWGDLPLWGEIMYYFFGIECNNNESIIKRWLIYYHKSHGKTVNAKYNK